MKKLTKLSLSNLEKTTNRLTENEASTYNGGFSRIELDMISHFACGTGSDYIIDNADFATVQSVAGSLSQSALGSCISVTMGGSTYYKKGVSFYNNDDLDWALGSATVYYNGSGNPVGVYDFYDFDPNTLAGLMGSIIGSITGGKSYKVYGGIHE